MTSATAHTAMHLPGTVGQPRLEILLGGSVVLIVSLLRLWCVHTPLTTCWSGGDCLADGWSRQLALTLMLVCSVWLYSLRTLGWAGHSDSSIVDRLWSITPVIACWDWLLSMNQQAEGWPRVLIMTLLCTAWGVRLTANFALKGGFSGGEDHRWSVLRDWFGANNGRLSFSWEAFNLLFICSAQQLIILAFTSPAAAAMLTADRPLNGLDFLATILFILLLIGETVADAQMFAFQTEKYRRIKANIPLQGTRYEAGFIQSGLWSLSRHPNYFCEVSMWWTFYVRAPPSASHTSAEGRKAHLGARASSRYEVMKHDAHNCPYHGSWMIFTVAAGCGTINWTLAGPLFLSVLFLAPKASLDLTEAISSRKYTGYAHYQRTVSKFVPWPPAREGTPPLKVADKLFIGWFIIGILITYLIDMEQVMVPDPDRYNDASDPLATPPWPPEPMVHAIHWWGRTADKLVLARPVWFKAGLWLEILVQAPYYLIAIAGFSRSRRWIRVPTIVYSTILLTILPIVLTEQYFGEHATESPYLLTAVYSPYIIMPLLLLWRVWDVDVFPGAPVDRSPSTLDLAPQSPTDDRSLKSGPSRPRLKSTALPVQKLHYRTTSTPADGEAAPEGANKSTRSPARRRAA